MKSHGYKILTGLGIASLCLAWSGFSYAGDGGVGYTTVSKASVKIQSYEQTASGVAEKVTFKTDDLINNLTHMDSGTKPAKNLQLVLLNYCDNPEGGSSLRVWDKDTNTFAVGSDEACLGTESGAVFDDKKDALYQGLDIDAEHFGMDEIDMEVEIKGGKVKKKVDSSRPVCLKKFKTLAMSGYESYDFIEGDWVFRGDGAVGNKAMRKSGSIKTNGGVFAKIDGNQVCD